jgi:hypothetical protein
LHAGVCGWVNDVDWHTLRVSMLQLMYTPNSAGKTDPSSDFSALPLIVQHHLMVCTVYVCLFRCS